MKNAKGIIDVCQLSPMKCGTTWLSSLVNKHPDVQVEQLRENYFSDEMKLISLPLKKSRCLYMRRNLNPKIMIADTLWHQNPDMKFVTMLRDPMERLKSHINHHIFKKREIKGRVNEYISITQSLGSIVYDPNPLVHAHAAGLTDNLLISKGLYFDLLQPYVKRFGKQNFLILSAEEAFLDPINTLTKIFQFLNLKDACDVFKQVELNAVVNKTDDINRNTRFVNFRKKIRVCPLDKESTQYLENVFSKQAVKLSKVIGPS